MSIDGVALLDKPAGVTSFSALGTLKKKLGTRRIGHTGTLDKFATGLLVVLIGRFTKLASARVLDEGVDVPDASVGVILSGSTSGRQLVQRLGRILRTGEAGGEKVAKLYILVTKGTMETQVQSRRISSIRPAKQRKL